LISIVRDIKCGKTEDLEKHIGKENFKYLVNKKFICVSNTFPHFWKISEKCIKRDSALKNKWCRFIAFVLWKLHIL